MVNGQQPMALRIAAARSAEAAGFASVWTADGAGDVLITLTAFALNTTRIRIGSGVLVWNRPPVITAIAAAQLAELTEGRFILGLGAGPREWNERWWGIPFDRPVGRMREYVEVIRGALAASPNEPYQYHGQHFRIDGLVRAFQRTGRTLAAVPPIWLGTTGPQMTRLAGRIADGVLLNPALSGRYLATVAVPALLSGVRSARRDRTALTIGALFSCVVDSDERVALRRVKATILAQITRDYFVRVWQSDGFSDDVARAQARWLAGDVEGALDAISDEFASTVCIAGTADRCRKRVAELLDIVDHAVLVVPTFMTDEATWLANCQALFEAFAR
jgi:alkanesulfonate monooxygenase SsuD/methylene tetrahydromethanopterin reductase-like flavin-dependent oxidoreductase (luciferase family)